MKIYKSCIVKLYATARDIKSSLSQKSNFAEQSIEIKDFIG